MRHKAAVEAKFMNAHPQMNLTSSQDLISVQTPRGENNDVLMQVQSSGFIPEVSQESLVES